MREREKEKKERERETKKEREREADKNDANLVLGYLPRNPSHPLYSLVIKVSS